MTSGPERASTSRRAFLVLAGLAPLALGACSAEKKDTVEVTPSDAGFPKNITHRFGTTVLKTRPSRIVALGAAEAETLVSLGLVPLSRPTADTTAWYRAGLRILGPAETPQTYDDGRQLTASLFTELEPEAFLSVGNRLSREEYESLSALAPVILAPDSVAAEDWEPVTGFIADVTGLQDAAKPLVEEAREDISESVEDYPDLKGATALFVSASSASGSDLVLAVQDSAPAAFFASLGLSAAPGLSGLAKGLKPASSRFPQGMVYLPRSRAAELSADVLVVNVPSGDFNNYRANKALSRDFPDFGAGTVYVISGDEAVALQRQSMRGAQWAARNIVPELAKSVYKSRQA
ncbi:TroA family protein [Arthrobacter cupressi]|uniref:ABC-type Fe3+-hydroxamate transport system, substrate-binding protein n=1 Tax=Arthrobacter cupressi TaxID=1045773 RepID=A0A1G8P044_9MICC|nr:ABC transporter substrate-binding protein [Arthrobacter cupressi]NYD76686.1 iron complex transport system substrate-binding protein [Arthrobacter cupressi]SDI85911.1 ABC-type Fe3+-hydroxamate transport system, substrate-binding protein [Arthrobacter cupressi]